MPTISSEQWEALLSRHPGAHLLQSRAWGDLKTRFGWEVEQISGAISSQVLFRKVIPGVKLAYLPKGPVCPDGQNAFAPAAQEFWYELDRICRKKRAIFLKVEPDAWTASQLEPGAPPCLDALGYWQFPERFSPPGFTLSTHAIQPLRTILVDLDGDEQQILARMKQKTRYNIKLAARRGITVSPSDDIGRFHQMMNLTGARDGFGVHSLDYYRSCYELFHVRGECELLVAQYEGQPLAALMVFARGKRSWYLYGASSNDHRELMPSYLLQWEAMRWARQRGCLEYDLWGVPDASETELEAQFDTRSDDLWGVYRFKRGFGGRLVRSAGPWDRVYNPVAYQAYRLWIQRTHRDSAA